jgi:hypothetical protein
MTNYPPACERFVDVLGLKTAFAAFMGKASDTAFSTSVDSSRVALCDFHCFLINGVALY